jgi:hypothetical protein
LDSHPRLRIFGNFWIFVDVILIYCFFLFFFVCLFFVFYADFNRLFWIYLGVWSTFPAVPITEPTLCSPYSVRRGDKITYIIANFVHCVKIPKRKQKKKKCWKHNEDPTFSQSGYFPIICCLPTRNLFFSFMSIWKFWLSSVILKWNFLFTDRIAQSLFVVTFSSRPFLLIPELLNIFMRNLTIFIRGYGLLSLGVDNIFYFLNFRFSVTVTLFIFTVLKDGRHTE